MASGPMLAHITKAENIRRGQRRTFGIDVVNAAGGRQQMQGWTMNFRLYRYMGDNAAALLTISGASIVIASTVPDATFDRLQVTLDNNSLDGYSLGKYYYVASRIDTDNEGDVAHGDFWIVG